VVVTEPNDAIINDEQICAWKMLRFLPPCTRSGYPIG
jgi:hypothetical protein